MGNDQVVLPVAPWCRRLDNLEIALVVVTLPWVAGEGLRRAELERQLLRLSDELPIGRVYFQRVSRAAAALVKHGCLRSFGSGRNIRFLAAAEGFAALLLNLQVLFDDPTLYGSELELKCAVVALWNQVHDCVVARWGGSAGESINDDFLDQVLTLRLWDRPVISEPTIEQAFDLCSLLQRARDLVDRRTEEARAQVKAEPELLRDGPSGPGLPTTFPLSPGNAGLGFLQTVQLVQTLTGSSARSVRLRAQLLRYEAFTSYLDSLTELFTAQQRSK